MQKSYCRLYYMGFIRVHTASTRAPEESVGVSVRISSGLLQRGLPLGVQVFLAEAFGFRVYLSVPKPTGLRVIPCN